METTYTTPRCDSRFRDYEDDFSDGPTPKAGTKRLFSNRDSKYSNISENFGENDFDDARDECHSEKRYRNSDWPLSNQASANNTPQSRAPLRNRGTPNSHIGRRSSSRIRPSRFLEGSMNDRISQKPPTPFLGDEEARERYEQDDYSRDRKMAQPRKTNRQSNTSTAESYADRSDVSRHSSIFRFGKSIAATFNPSNWKIWSKPQPQEANETPEQKILRERRERAEAIYQELKRNGQFRDSAIPPSFKNQEEDLRKHDSGVAFGRHSQASSTSRQEKRKGMVFLEPPQFDNLPQSPASNVPGSAPGSGRRNSFGFKKPSLRNIKSFAQSGDNVSTSGGHHQVRRIPSRKELHKQQKLVKRVSDLEMKLEAARRQLSDALGEPLPAVPPLPSAARIGRSRFVPGALSTLLSERLLTGYPGSDDEEDDEDECGDIGTEKSPNEVEISNRVGHALMRDELLDDVVMTEAANSGRDEAEKDAMQSTLKTKTKKPLSTAVSIPNGLDLGMKIKPTRVLQQPRTRLRHLTPQLRIMCQLRAILRKTSTKKGSQRKTR
ncbi:hypothetical protein B0O99DRAFT_217690 [Bisporella sp. PMI_857]|nr:hypothetical protein B0O99DRAFT_217690 [Bisporella sp. PMI_857]